MYVYMHIYIYTCMNKIAFTKLGDTYGSRACHHLANVTIHLAEKLLSLFPQYLAHIAQATH